MTGIYTHQKSYDEILQLKKISVCEEPDAKHLLRFILEHKIPHNSYVPYSRGGREGFIPLAHFCTTIKGCKNLILYYLKKHKENFLNPCEGPFHLCTVSRVEYLKILHKEGVLSIEKEGGLSNGALEDRIFFGDLERLSLLVGLGYVSREGEKLGGEGFLLNLLKFFVQQVGAFRGNKEWGVLTDTLMDRYVETIKLFSGRLDFSEGSANFMVAFYLHKFLAIYVEKGGSIEKIREPPTYHRFMEEKSVALLRPLLNDYGYVETCKLIGQPVQDIAYGYNLSWGEGM